MMTVLNCAVES